MLVGGAAPPGGIGVVDVVVDVTVDEVVVVLDVGVVVELVDPELVLVAGLLDEDDAGDPEPPHPASSAEMPAAAIDAAMLARVIRSPL